MVKTKIVKYIGKGRRGTRQPARIWATGEQKELPDQIADQLLAEPYDFKEVKKAVKKGLLSKLRKEDEEED